MKAWSSSWPGLSLCGWCSASFGGISWHAEALERYFRLSFTTPSLYTISQNTYVSKDGLFVLEMVIARYGYLAILTGTILEGGTLLSMGGFAAHQGYLDLVPWVVLTGLLGSFVDAQIWFYLGRSRGLEMVKKRSHWQKRLEKVNAWLKRYDAGFIVFARFIPGVRTLSSLAAGMSGISAGRYVVLNATGALIWAAAVAVSGYLSGLILKTLLGEIKHLEVPILIGIGILGIAAGILFHRLFRKGKEP